MRIIGKILLCLGLVIMIVFSLSNTVSQYSLLKQAEEENKNLEVKVSFLENENRKLLRIIDYATSSAYLERQARIQLGLGTSNDLWINGLKEKKYNDEFLTR